MNPFDIGKNIRQISRNIRYFLSQVLKDYDLNEGQFEYFIIINKNNGINQKELSEMMFVSKASVTKAIKKLLSTGLIERVKNEHDLRNYDLFITEKGKKLAKHFHSYEAIISEVMFEGISEEEVDLLYSIITRIKENSKRL